MGGLFDEIGPCTINEELETELNPLSWNELSNLVMFSQPIGIGFSYADTVRSRTSKAARFLTMHRLKQNSLSTQKGQN